MKGIVFSEFLAFVEQVHDADMVDDLIEATGVGGAYTSVGTYPHSELVALVTELGRRTGQPVPALINAFGSHLASVFARTFPDYFARSSSLFDFLASVDQHIHVEVRKIYPDAELPSFRTIAKTERTMTMDYSSPRHMETLAVGLIEGTARHYATPVKVESSPGPDGGTRFTLTLT